MLHFHFLNVGAGDCTIVQYEGQNSTAFGLIDSNRRKIGESRALAKLRELGATDLSFICLTHLDADHYTGFREVLEHYRGKIGVFYSCPLGATQNDPSRIKKLHDTYNAIITENGGTNDRRLFDATAELTWIIREAHNEFIKKRKWEELSGPANDIAPPCFGNDIAIECLLPLPVHKGEFYKHIESGEIGVAAKVSTNQMSVVLRFRYRDRSVLLTADAPAVCWREHKRTYQDRKERSVASTIVTLPHHGSKHDCSEEVLHILLGDEVADQHCIISADGKRHPHQEVMQLLGERAASRHCTNFFSGWQPEVRHMLFGNSLEPELARHLNEIAAPDINPGEECKGDIRVTITEEGSVDVTTSRQTICPCDPDLGALFSYLEG